MNKYYGKFAVPIQNNIRAIKNSFWLLLEQITRLTNGLLLGVFIARTYTPDSFGMYSLLIAVFSLLLPISRFGLDQISVREFTGLSGVDAGKIASSSFLISFISTSILLLIALLMLCLTNSSFEGFGSVVLLLLVSLYSSCFNFVDFWYQSQTNSAPIARIKILCSLISLSIKLVMVQYVIDLRYIVLMVGVEALVISICFMILYLIRYRYFNFKISLDFSQFPRMSRSGFYILISSLFVIVNTRVDQFFISFYLGNYDLGLYAAVVKINEAMVVVPFILSVSLLPKLTRMNSSDNKQFEFCIGLMYKVFSLYSLVLLAVVYFAGEYLVILVYGEEYGASISAFLILTGACFFNCISIVNARYLMVKGQEHLITVRVFVCSVLNVLLNFLMIPVYGIEGAAASTLISSIAMSCCFDSFYSDLFRIRFHSFIKRKL